MSDAANTPDKKLSGLDPRKPFFIAVTVSNVDGALNLDSDDIEGFITLEEAITFAKEHLDEYDDEIFIYECRPRRRLIRVQVIVENLEIAQTHSRE